MAIRKLISLVSLLSLALACSKQGEGERCMMSNGSTGDCDDNLVCQQPNASRNVCIDDITVDRFDCLPHRCCPPAGTPASDSRCSGYTGISSVTDTGGASAGGNSGVGGSSSAAGGTTSVTSSTGGTSNVGGTSSTGDAGVSDTGGTSTSST